MRPRFPFFLLVGPVLAACSARVDSPTFVALSEGHALDGRSGIEVYAPASRVAALEGLEEQARYWGRAPEPSAELDAILARHDVTTAAGQSALFAELNTFLHEHMVFTESTLEPGLHDLEVTGDHALAYRIGQNPGGEFRDPVRFVRVGGRWYLEP